MKQSHISSIQKEWKERRQKLRVVWYQIKREGKQEGWEMEGEGGMGDGRGERQEGVKVEGRGKEREKAGGGEVGERKGGREEGGRGRGDSKSPTFLAARQSS